MDLVEDLKRFEDNFLKTLEGAKYGNPYANFMGKQEQDILVRLREAMKLLDKTVKALDDMNRYNQPDLSYHNSPTAIVVYDALKSADEMGIKSFTVSSMTSITPPHQD